MRPNPISTAARIGIIGTIKRVDIFEEEATDDH
jgi:hypothetical protein